MQTHKHEPDKLRRDALALSIAAANNVFLRLARSPASFRPHTSNSLDEGVVGTRAGHVRLQMGRSPLGAPGPGDTRVVLKLLRLAGTPLKEISLGEATSDPELGRHRNRQTRPRPGSDRVFHVRSIQAPRLQPSWAAVATERGACTCTQAFGMWCTSFESGCQLRSLECGA